MVTVGSFAYHCNLGNPQKTLISVVPFTMVKIKTGEHARIVILCIYFLTYFLLWYRIRRDRMVTNNESGEECGKN
jgi:hypothetical protein